MSAAAKFSLAFFRAYGDGVSPMVRLKGEEGTSGVTENGVICKNEEGLPQGGGRSFSLASLLLAYGGRSAPDDSDLYG